MCKIVIVAAMVMAAGAAMVQTETQTQTAAPKTQSAADYFRHWSASSSSSSSSSSAPSAVYTSCKALRDRGGIPAGMSRDDAVQAARDAGCSDDEVNAIAAAMDLLPH